MTHLLYKSHATLKDDTSEECPQNQRIKVTAQLNKMVQEGHDGGSCELDKHLFAVVGGGSLRSRSCFVSKQWEGSITQEQNVYCVGDGVLGNLKMDTDLKVTIYYAEWWGGVQKRAQD